MTLHKAAKFMFYLNAFLLTVFWRLSLSGLYYQHITIIINSIAFNDVKIKYPLRSSNHEGFF